MPAQSNRQKAPEVADAKKTKADDGGGSIDESIPDTKSPSDVNSSPPPLYFGYGALTVWRFCFYIMMAYTWSHSLIGPCMFNVRLTLFREMRVFSK